MSFLVATVGAFPTWLRVLFALLLLVSVAELCVWGWRRAVRSRFVALLRASLRYRGDWNYARVRNLPIDPVCRATGHALVLDRTPEQRLNPAALSMTGHCSRCRREWRRDPQGLQDGWLPARRSPGEGPRHAPRAEPLPPVGQDTSDWSRVEWSKLNEPSKPPRYGTAAHPLASDYAEEESPEIDGRFKGKPRRGWDDLGELK